MTSTQYSKPIAQLIADAEAAGFTYVPAHSQFFELSGATRKWIVFTNERGGFDHGYRADMTNEFIGEYKTLRALRGRMFEAAA